MKFHPGDLVQFKGTLGMAAKAGATARVVRGNHYAAWTPRELVDVEWDDTSLRNQQSDGDYFVDTFELVKPLSKIERAIAAYVKEELHGA